MARREENRKDPTPDPNASPEDAPNRRLRLGRAGEALAASYLEALGLRILHRNFEVYNGEIDLVARDGPVLVFAEVRTRWRGDGIGPLESIGRAKRRQLHRTALAFLEATGRGDDCDVRIDVLGVAIDRRGAEIEYVENAC
jgi:putative endonuclease